MSTNNTLSSDHSKYLHM